MWEVIQNSIWRAPTYIREMVWCSPLSDEFRLRTSERWCGVAHCPMWSDCCKRCLFHKAKIFLPPSASVKHDIPPDFPLKAIQCVSPKHNVVGSNSFCKSTSEISCLCSTAPFPFFCKSHSKFFTIFTVSHSDMWITMHCSLCISLTGASCSLSVLSWGAWLWPYKYKSG